MQKERIRMQEQEGQNKAHSEYIHRKSLCQLIYRKIEKVATISLEQYKQAIETYPELSELYTLVKDFYAVIFSKSPEKLSPWMEYARKFEIPELQTFVEGISKDIDAVKNGIAYTFNNGLAEGSVNKIKVIKRIMYGRNSFELLKAKVLFHELFQCESN